MVSPAAKVNVIAPESAQCWPGVSTRSWPLVPLVQRKTAAGQLLAVGVLALTAIRITVIGWSSTNCPPTHEPLRLPGKKVGKSMRELAAACAIRLQSAVFTFGVPPPWLVTVAT